MTQTLIVYFLRTNKIPFLRSRPSKAFGISAAVLLVVAQVIPYIPGLNSAFGMVPPHPVSSSSRRRRKDCSSVVAFLRVPQRDHRVLCDIGVDR
jgi:hypothetical protein